MSDEDRPEEMDADAAEISEETPDVDDAQGAEEPAGDAEGMAGDVEDTADAEEAEDAEEATDADESLEEPEEEAAPVDTKEWYVLKVGSNRETTTQAALERRAKMAGLEHLFGDIVVPTEQVTEIKNGKKRSVKRKVYPGYIFVNMELTDESWFLVRETPGVGDFTGSGGKPIPMEKRDIEKIVKPEVEEPEAAGLQLDFSPGDRVKVNQGDFENFEGEVGRIDPSSGKVTVLISIFGRQTEVELEYWRIEKV